MGPTTNAQTKQTPAPSEVPATLTQSETWKAFQKSSDAALSAIVAQTPNDSNPTSFHSRARSLAAEFKELEARMGRDGLEASTKEKLAAYTKNLAGLTSEFNTEQAKANPLGLSITPQKNGTRIVLDRSAKEPLSIQGIDSKGRVTREGSYTASEIAELRSGSTSAISTGGGYFIPRRVESLGNGTLRYTIDLPKGYPETLRLTSAGKQMEFLPGQGSARSLNQAVRFNVDSGAIIQALEKDLEKRIARAKALEQSKSSGAITPNQDAKVAYVPRRFEGRWVVAGNTAAHISADLYNRAKQQQIGFHQISENSRTKIFRLYHGNSVDGAIVEVPRNISPKELGERISPILEKELGPKLPQGTRSTGIDASKATESINITSKVPGLETKPVDKQKYPDAYAVFEKAKREGISVEMIAANPQVEKGGKEIVFQLYREHEGKKTALGEPVIVSQSAEYLQGKNPGITEEYFSRRNKALSEALEIQLKALEKPKLEVPPTTKPETPQPQVQEPPKAEVSPQVSQDEARAKLLKSLEEEIYAVTVLTSAITDTWVESNGKAYLLLPSERGFIVRTPVEGGEPQYAKLDYQQARKIVNASDINALPRVFDVGEYKDGRWISADPKQAPEESMRKILLARVEAEHAEMLTLAQGKTKTFVPLPTKEGSPLKISLYVSEDKNQVVHRAENGTTVEDRMFNLTRAKELIEKSAEPAYFDDSTLYQSGSFEAEREVFSRSFSDLSLQKIEKVKDCTRMFVELSAKTKGELKTWASISDSQSVLKLDADTLILRHKGASGEEQFQRLNLRDSIAEISKLENLDAVRAYVPGSFGVFKDDTKSWMPE